MWGNCVVCELHLNNASFKKDTAGQTMDKQANDPHEH